ncbi:CsbD family protein [Novosphingobium sp. G106]|uniref:CsbD family protein n=1 Tax=Novosphingobium sp. G106 TaxID=2849500 RepID=UPI001C2D4F43|nr:CsbD family protein [Novosphingobium sp. G106]MBV1687621.1 CsbD family protein [Novosphingobium sp. G106]
MGELKDKAKGLANEAAGNIKQAVGKARNDPAQKAEGVAQERKGEAQQAVGKVKGALGDSI